MPSKRRVGGDFMSEKVKNSFSSFELFLKNRSHDYMQYGRYLVKELTVQDALLRLVSFFGDIVAMFAPIIILDYIFLLQAGGVIPYAAFKASSAVINVLLLISILCTNAVIMYIYKGQSFGKLAMNLKVVRDVDNKELHPRTAAIRELVGISIPVFILYILFHLLGLIIFMAVNGIVMIVDKKQRSIIDIVLKTKVVLMDDKGKKQNIVKEVVKEEEKVIPAENKYDLHVYSSFSHDGELEVEDLLKKAQISGIQVLSITDHNCVKANKLADRLAPMYKIEYIPGINIDCQYEGRDVRLLGYYINYNDERFIQIEHENLAKEKAVSSRRIQLFEEFTGFKVNTEKLARYNRFQIITEEMIARDILSNTEYRKTKLLAPYLTGSKKDKPITNFRIDFFAKGAPAYVPIVHPQLSDMISLIHACGGVAVLAHPMKSLGKEKELLEKLLQEEKVDGIEIFTPYHSSADMKYLIPIAKKYELDITEGSEYHRPKRNNFILGKTSCPKDVEEIIKMFITKHKK